MKDSTTSQLLNRKVYKQKKHRYSMLDDREVSGVLNMKDGKGITPHVENGDVEIKIHPVPGTDLGAQVAYLLYTLAAHEKLVDYEKNKQGDWSFETERKFNVTYTTPNYLMEIIHGKTAIETYAPQLSKSYEEFYKDEKIFDENGKEFYKDEKKPPEDKNKSLKEMIYHKNFMNFLIEKFGPKQNENPSK